MAKTETMENTAMVKSGYAALANNDLMAELAEDLTGLLRQLRRRDRQHRPGVRDLPV